MLNGSCFERLRHKHAEEGERTEAGGRLPDHQDCSFPFPSASGSPVWGRNNRSCSPQHAGEPDEPKGKRPLGRRILWGGGRALACRICLTGVIESVLNYYSNWRACLTVELPVRQVGREPEPVKARQSMETRSVGLMDFSTPLCLRTQQSRRGGGGGAHKNRCIVTCEPSGDQVDVPPCPGVRGSAGVSQRRWTF